MICRVISQKGLEGWVLRIESPLLPALPFVERTIRCVAENGAAFPLPPVDESGRWAGSDALSNASDFKGIDAVYRRVLENVPGNGEVALFGEYLTAVLLGPNLDVLETVAEAVDLRLVLDDPNLERLPWEMMYGQPDGGAGLSVPLSARPNRRIAINREVALKENETRLAPQGDSPLKVLFVAESKIDPILRPGAEFLGLLRHLRIPANPTFQGDFVSASIRLRFLPEADIDQLKKECNQFKPAVVHFICHGQSDAAGGPSRIVLRKRDSGRLDGESRQHPVTAAELVGELTEDNGWLPPIFVLNACYTATFANEPAQIEDGHLPFAAQLVRLGAAVALGMTGEVADPACQMFTLRFYQALLTNTSLVDAASQARRAVLTAWPEYQQSIEWSRPALFLASGLNGLMQLNSLSNFDVMTAAERYRKDGTRPRMMCDRYDMMVAYDRLVSLTEKPGSDALLVAFAVEDSSRGMGKTRLLEEFAIRAVVDGFVPCLMRAEGEMPRTLLDFALALTDAINEARRNFGVAPVVETESRTIAFEALRNPPQIERERAMKRLRSLINDMEPVDAAEVLDAIRIDCARLVKDVETATGLRHRVVVLMDEFDRWVAAYDKVLEKIDFAGLGTPKEPIPVVLNFVTTSAEGQAIEQKLRALPSERRPVLRRFNSEIEIEMIYRQLLLSERRRAPKQGAAAKEIVKGFFKTLHGKTGGLPQSFIDARIEGYIEAYSERNDAFVDADYESVLRTYGA